LTPLGYVPSNLVLVCVKLLTQVLTLWSGSSTSSLPELLREALEGPVGGMHAIQAMLGSMAVSGSTTSSPVASRNSVDVLSSSTLFDRLLALDFVAYSQLLNRFPVEVSSAHAGRQSVYLTGVMECMVALRLLVVEHSPSSVSPNVPAAEHSSSSVSPAIPEGGDRFRSPGASKFDALWSGAHLASLLSPVQDESLSERRGALARAQGDVDSWTGAREGMAFEAASSALREARRAWTKREQAVEMRIVKNMVNMVRRAQGKPRRRLSKLPEQATATSSSAPVAAVIKPSLDVSASVATAVVDDDDDMPPLVENYVEHDISIHASNPNARADSDLDVDEPVSDDEFDAPSSSAGKSSKSEDARAKFDARTLLHFDLSTFSVFGNVLLPRMEGARWMGLQNADEDEDASESHLSSTSSSAASTRPSAPHLVAPRLDRTESNKSEGDVVVSSRAPLCSLLLPSRPSRLQLFHDLLATTRVTDRATPDFAFDTSMRWAESFAEGVSGSAATKVSWKNSASRTEVKGAKTAPEKLSLFEQLCGQLSATSPQSLRGPIGEYSWRTSFVGAADEGAQGFVGMFKQSEQRRATACRREGWCNQSMMADHRIYFVMSLSFAESWRA
jgi:hypothetical protein